MRFRPSAITREEECLIMKALTMYSNDRKEAQKEQFRRLLMYIIFYAVIIAVFMSKIVASLTGPIQLAVKWAVFLGLVGYCLYSIRIESSTLLGFFSEALHKYNDNYFLSETWRVYKIPKILTGYFLEVESPRETTYRLQIYKSMANGKVPVYDIDITKEEYETLTKAKRKNKILIFEKHQLKYFKCPQFRNTF